MNGNAGVPPLSSSFPRKRESMHSGNGVSWEDTGVPPTRGTRLGRGANFHGLMSDTPIAGDYVKAEGKVGRMGAASGQAIGKQAFPGQPRPTDALVVAPEGGSSPTWRS